MGNRVLTFADVIDDIRDALGEADGEFVANIYNQVSSKQIRYTEDSFWDEMDTDDDGNCLYCGYKCWEGDMCDEQKAGGFEDARVIEEKDRKNGLYGAEYNGEKF